MRKTMNYKGFVTIIGTILIVFFTLHYILQNDLHRKEEDLKNKQVKYSQMAEENMILESHSEYVETTEFIAESAKKDYGFITKNDIPFRIQGNLDGYTIEELDIYMDE